MQTCFLAQPGKYQFFSQGSLPPGQVDAIHGKNSTVASKGWMRHTWDSGGLYSGSSGFVRAIFSAIGTVRVFLHHPTVAGRGEGVFRSSASHQSRFSSPPSPLLPACANPAIAGTIRVPDPMILTGKEGAPCDE